MSQNQAKSNYKDCSFRNRDSFVKGTRLSVFILAKSQAGWKFEVLEVASLVSIYIFKEQVKLQVSKTASRSFQSTNPAHNNKHQHSFHVSEHFYLTFIRSKSRDYRISQNPLYTTEASINIQPAQVRNTNSPEDGKPLLTSTNTLTSTLDI